VARVKKEYSPTASSKQTTENSAKVHEHDKDQQTEWNSLIIVTTLIVERTLIPRIRNFEAGKNTLINRKFRVPRKKEHIFRVQRLKFKILHPKIFFFDFTAAENIFPHEKILFRMRKYFFK
jgi:hypothetical protein